MVRATEVVGELSIVMKGLARVVYALIVPGGLLLAGALVGLYLAPATEPWPTVVAAYPYFALVCGLLLAWRFNQGRLLLAVAILAVADRGLLLLPGHQLLTDLLSVLIPLNLMLLILLPEVGILGSRSLARMVLLVVQGGFAVALLRPQHALIAANLQLDLLPGTWTAWTTLPDAGVIAFVVAIAIVAVRFLAGLGPLAGGFVWALVAAFLALRAAQLGGASTSYFATAQLVLCVAAIERSYALAYRDELTGLPTRRALDETLERLHGEYAVAMLDLDHFKQLNDTYGHDSGDQVLRMVASRLAQVTGGGKAFRYGGEEFTVVFRGRTADEAKPHLDAIRRAIAATPFTLRGSDRPKRKPRTGDARTAGGDGQVRVTVSIGVAEPGADQETPGDVMRAADRALYRAKNAGRNRVAA